MGFGATPLAKTSPCRHVARVSTKHPCRDPATSESTASGLSHHQRTLSTNHNEKHEESFDLVVAECDTRKKCSKNFVLFPETDSHLLAQIPIATKLQPFGKSVPNGSFRLRSGFAALRHHSDTAVVILIFSAHGLGYRRFGNFLTSQNKSRV